MHHFHAIVWLDHREAKIYEVGADDVQKIVIHSTAEPSHHIHHKAGAIGSGHAAEDEKYFAAVAKALQPVGEVLIVGPGSEKNAFANFLTKHDKAIAAKVVGVESADHPSDGEVIKHARKVFKTADRMQPQRGSKPS